MGSSNDFIYIYGAKENNLNNISFSIPKNKITCVSGVSGSGKSSLVNGVIAGEAFRRERMKSAKNNYYYALVRPKFDAIKNLPQVLLVNQKPLMHSVNSSVATASGINELLRNFFLKNGVIKCQCGSVVDDDVSYNTVIKLLKKLPENQKKAIFVKYAVDKNFNKDIFIKYARKNNFSFFYIDGKVRKFAVDDVYKIKNDNFRDILIKIDSVEELIAKNILSSKIVVKVEEQIFFDFSHQTFCPICHNEYQKKSPSLFTTSKLSEKNGCCDDCLGFGKKHKFNFTELIIKENSFDDDFIRLPCSGEVYSAINLYKSSIKRILKSAGCSNSVPYCELPVGVQEEVCVLIKEKLIKRKENELLREFVLEELCILCDGTGFNYKARAVKVFGNKSISDILAQKINEVVSSLVDPAINDILVSLDNLSIGHLQLSRLTDTLSGGELQRVKLARAIALELKDYLLILDEPSSGLSAGDVQNLFKLLSKIKNKGNSILIVDHSELIINLSDFNINLGPKSGSSGGCITAYSDDVSADGFGDFVDILSPQELLLSPINFNNIKDLRVAIPLGVVTVVVGNSGSGKSSLIQGIDEAIKANSLLERKNLHVVHKMIILGQRQIKANKRSSILTFIDIGDDIRDIYASLPVSKMLQLTAGDFTYNSVGGCQYCSGDGVIDGIKCFSCSGKRFKNSTLSVHLGGSEGQDELNIDLNIHEFLNLPIDNILKICLKTNASSKITDACELMIKLGLGHLNFGRSMTEISGGESQRLKLAKFILSNNSDIFEKSKHILIALDEPFRGLDKKNARDVYNFIKQMTLHNNTFIIVEHNNFIIDKADFVIEIGPGVGDAGGKVMFYGACCDYKMEYAFSVKNVINRIGGISVPLNVCSKEDLYFIDTELFSKNYTISNESEVSYFKSKQELIDSAKNVSNDGLFYFNPFCDNLFLVGIVSRSDIKLKLLEFSKLGFGLVLIDGEHVKIGGAHKLINNYNIWDVFMATPDPALAYSFGGGWIALAHEQKNKNSFKSWMHFSTRLVDIKEKIIGSREVAAETFNLYFNRCGFCDGRGVNKLFNFFIKNEEISIMNIEFYIENLRAHIKKHLLIKIKEAVNLFKSEGLIDLSRPFVELDQREKNVCFFGLPGFSFIKKNGRKNALSDVVEWRGLIKIMMEHMDALSAIDGNFAVQMTAVSNDVVCYSCGGTRFNKEIDYYKVRGKSIFEVRED